MRYRGMEVAQNLLGRQITARNDNRTLHVIGSRPVLLSCDLPTRNLHSSPCWLILCPLAAMPMALLAATSPLHLHIPPSSRPHRLCSFSSCPFAASNPPPSQHNGRLHSRRRRPEGTPGPGRASRQPRAPSTRSRTIQPVTAGLSIPTFRLHNAIPERRGRQRQGHAATIDQIGLGGRV